MSMGGLLFCRSDINLPISCQLDLILPTHVPIVEGCLTSTLVGTSLSVEYTYLLHSKITCTYYYYKLKKEHFKGHRQYYVYNIQNSQMAFMSSE